MKMSILKYLKPLPKASDEKLPDPNGAMSATVPPSAIMKANEEVSKIHEQQQDMTRGTSVSCGGPI